MTVHDRGTSGPSVEDRDPVRSPASGGAVRITYVGDMPTVHVAGRVGRTTVVEVSGTIRGLVATGVRELTVDLSASWDTDGLLPLLARTRADLADEGGALRLSGVRVPELMAALRSAPLDVVFLVYAAAHGLR